MASLSRVGTRLMRCGACPRAALVGYKTTTGIVGIEADPDAVQNLSQLLKKMLREVRTIPETAQYRKTVEQLANERLAVLAKDIAPEMVSPCCFFFLSFFYPPVASILPPVA